MPGYLPFHNIRNFVPYDTKTICEDVHRCVCKMLLARKTHRHPRIEGGISGCYRKVYNIKQILSRNNLARHVILDKGKAGTWQVCKPAERLQLFYIGGQP